LNAGTLCLATADALLHVEHLLTIDDGSDSNVFNCSSGRIRLDPGAELEKIASSTITIDTPLDNQGTVRDENGILSLNGGSVATAHGPYTSDSGTPLAFNGGAYTIAGSLAGAGTTQINTDTTLGPTAIFAPATVHETGGSLTLQGAGSTGVTSYNLD